MLDAQGQRGAAEDGDDYHGGECLGWTFTGLMVFGACVIAIAWLKGWLVR